LCALAALSATGSAWAERRLITGVNLAGLEFNSSRLPGERDRDFVAPSAADLDYFHGRGARAVRVPFLWERVQPRLGDDFDAGYWSLIESLVAAAGARSMQIILDAHQYGRRQVGGRAEIIGESAQVTRTHFASFWRSVAERLREQPHVIFGLTNEPHDQNRRFLVTTQNEAISEIRATGARQLVLASGDAWSGAHSWISTGNGEAMLDIVDPASNFAFDVHQYLDDRSSGTQGQCVTDAGNRLTPFTQWAREHGRRGFLGEFGAGASDACAAELSALLSHIADNRDVWLGWTYWAGGPWWPEDYPLSIQPASLSEPHDRPQMAVLQRYFE
jgi:endoglucanase